MLCSLSRNATTAHERNVTTYQADAHVHVDKTHVNSMYTLSSTAGHTQPAAAGPVTSQVSFCLCAQQVDRTQIRILRSGALWRHRQLPPSAGTPPALLTDGYPLAQGFQDIRSSTCSCRPGQRRWQPHVLRVAVQVRIKAFNRE